MPYSIESQTSIQWHIHFMLEKHVDAIQHWISDCNTTTHTMIKSVLQLNGIADMYCNLLWWRYVIQCFLWLCNKQLQEMLLYQHVLPLDATTNHAELHYCGSHFHFVIHWASITSYCHNKLQEPCPRNAYCHLRGTIKDGVYISSGIYCAGATTWCWHYKSWW